MSPHLAINQKQQVVLRSTQKNIGGQMFNLLSANTQLMSLQLGLREFGLHPVEWRIIKKTKSRFVIQSTTEDNLYFVGEVKNDNSKQWRYIQLAGL